MDQIMGREGGEEINNTSDQPRLTPDAGCTVLPDQGQTSTTVDNNLNDSHKIEWSGESSNTSTTEIPSSLHTTPQLLQPIAKSNVPGNAQTPTCRNFKNCMVIHHEDEKLQYRQNIKIM